MTEPTAGTPATVSVGSDRYPYVVVSATAKTVKVRRVKATGEGQPTGGYGWDRVATEEDLKNPYGDEETYTLRKNGRWVRKGEPLHGGSRIYFGKARDYRDPTF